jgi:hypothetical protein
MDISIDADQDGSLPSELTQWIDEKSQYFRSISGHGSIEIMFQDGHPITYRDTYYHKVSGRNRIRTTKTAK